MSHIIIIRCIIIRCITVITDINMSSIVTTQIMIMCTWGSFADFLTVA